MYRILTFIFIMLSISACDSKQPEKASVNEPAKSVVKAVDEASVAQEVKPELKAIPQVVVNEAVPSMSGEQVYNKFCQACHASGAAGAPKLGDVAAWKPRVSKGKDALYVSAFKGVAGTAMMARGTCAACSDDELKAAVDFMLERL